MRRDSLPSPRWHRPEMSYYHPTPISSLNMLNRYMQLLIICHLPPSLLPTLCRLLHGPCWPSPSPAAVHLWMLQTSSLAFQISRKASLPSNTLHIARTTEGLEHLVQVRQELKAEKNAMASSFVTIHLALNMTTRLVGQPPQPTTPTPWPLRHHLSSQRWRPHAHPVPPLLLLYNITRGETGYTLTL